MDAQSFDNLARRLTMELPRRSALAVMAGALPPLLLSGASPVAAGCKKVGKECDKNKDCCDNARCQGKACKCKSRFSECGGKCFDLDKEENHCGACNTACALGASCQDGICACARNDNAFACGTTGGQCGPACAANEACVDGTCVSCAEACPGENCQLCIRLADGATLCGAGATSNCSEPCTSDDDCEGATYDVCAVSAIVQSDGSVFTVGESCFPPAVAGLCAAVPACNVV